MSHEALSSEQFAFQKATPRAMGGDPYHRLSVPGASPDEPKGEMAWHYRSGEIGALDVDPAHRRQGIATAMWHEGRRIAAATPGVKPPRHSSDRTDLGEAWARSLGDRLPRRKQSESPTS